MLKTTLKLSTVRNNGGTTSVVANLADGREVWIANSTAIGGKRAIYEVLSGAGTGSTLAETVKMLRRFEKVEATIIERAHVEALRMDEERYSVDYSYSEDDDDLLRAAAELGIDLNV